MCQMANKGRVVSSLLLLLEESRKSGLRQKQSSVLPLYISWLYLLIHDSSATLLNVCLSEELSLPKHKRVGQLHSLD